MQILFDTFTYLDSLLAAYLQANGFFDLVSVVKQIVKNCV